MKTFKYLAIASALVLMGAGCATKTDTTIEAEGGLNPIDTTSTMPAGSDSEGDGMMVGGDAMMEGDPIPGIGITGSADAEAGIEHEDIGAMMQGSEHAIIFNGSSYSPASLTVKVGDTVTWKNEGTSGFWPASNVHPTHQSYDGTTLSQHCGSDPDGAFDACSSIGAGGSYSFTFDKAGSWKWHDHLRARLGGTITVQ